MTKFIRNALFYTDFVRNFWAQRILTVSLWYSCHLNEIFFIVCCCKINSVQTYIWFQCTLRIKCSQNCTVFISLSIQFNKMFVLFLFHLHFEFHWKTISFFVFVRVQNVVCCTELFKFNVFIFTNSINFMYFSFQTVFFYKN